MHHLKILRPLLGLLLVLPLGTTLIACSSAPSYGNAPEKLSIRILPNNSKQFIYRVGITERAERRLDPRRRAGPPPGKRDYEKPQKRAGHVVAATGYCRQGYLELDFRLGNVVQWLRGECREGASAADIETFADRAAIELDNLQE